jgi:sterol desaturase/sphingolipid hydroxylase (fatty acid hydroxylase superfamily)
MSLLYSVIYMTLALTLIIGARYLAVAGGMYALIWMRPEAKVGGRRLNRDRPKPRIMLHEIKLSLLSSWIYALPAALTYEAWLHGHTKVYLNVAQYGWPWLLISGAIYLIVQDTYYYWAHRAMHLRWLFKWTHAAHHRSRQPTPFASFAFSAWEAATAAWVLPALTFFVPIHPAVILVLLTIMTMMAVFNHCGWEVFPDWMVLRGPIAANLITATHHNAHHTHFDRNFGLYFRFWDRVMGTDLAPEADIEPAMVRANPALEATPGP